MPPPTIPFASTSSPKSQPIYFWRPTTRGNGYLSQWYWSKFTVSGDTYVTAEMYMMVQKARLFSDEETARKMLDTEDPKTHKELGRQVRGFDGEVWDSRKFDIVTQGNWHKFTISEDAQTLRGMLEATGERELVEASPQDRIWGVGFREDEAGRNRERWGANLLGKASMGVRGRLREEGWEGKED
jgi:ribA/ribD-fused uncharacterized protein